MPTEVFIAYSRKDIESACLLQNRLEELGLACFRDVTSIPGSALWMEEITNALQQCSCVVAVISPNSVSSDHVMKELSLAIEARRAIIPVFLKADVNLTGAMPYILAGHQRIVASPSLSDVLPLVAQAALRVVDRCRHAAAYQETASILDACNYDRTLNWSEALHGLSVGDFKHGSARVDAGRYFLAGKLGEYMVSRMEDSPLLTDWVLESRFRKDFGPDDEWFGFEFGEKWPGNYYQMLLSGQSGVRLSKHWNRVWSELGRHMGFRHSLPGNAAYHVRIVRRSPSIHFFVNGMHALSAQDRDIRSGRLGLVVSGGIQISVEHLEIRGLNLEGIYSQAMGAFYKLDVIDARRHILSIRDRDPDFRPAEIARNLVEVRPDRRRTVLLVVGQGVLPQIHDGAVARRFEELILERGSIPELRYAMRVTDTGVLAEPIYLECPIISLGGPVGNKVTEKLQSSLPTDSVSSKWVSIQHNMDQGGASVLLWGGTAEETAQAAERFVASGLLDRFLKQIWGSA